MAGECKYQVSGTIQVKTILKELKKQTLPIIGAKVKIFKSQLHKGIYVPWGEGKTKSDGSFSIPLTLKGKKCETGRFIKVKLKFQNDLLELRHKHAGFSPFFKVKANTIYRSSEKVTTSELDLGKMIFKKNANYSLGVGDFRKHAELWTIYSKVFDYLKSFGEEFGFQKRVAVKYPHNSLISDYGPDGKRLERSYANELNQTIYIIKNSRTDDFTLRTLVHELMHIWAYQHIKGPSGLVGYWLQNLTTHTPFAPAHIAFHEGFAEFAAQRILQEVFEKKASKPYNRSFLTTLLAGKKLKFSEGKDSGWTSLLLSMTLENIQNYTYFGPGDVYGEDLDKKKIIKRDLSQSEYLCERTFITLKDILSTFLPLSQGGENVKRAKLNFGDFLNRLVKRVPELTSKEARKYIELVNPRSYKEPFELFCN